MLRNRTSNAWKAQTAIQSIGFDNVTTTDVIYIHASKDGGGNGINSVTNGTVKYSYSDDYYYIVPTEDGSVKVAFNTGTSLNTVGVYKQVVSATLGANGYSTFASTNANTAPNKTPVKTGANLIPRLFARIASQAVPSASDANRISQYAMFIYFAPNADAK